MPCIALLCIRLFDLKPRLARWGLGSRQDLFFCKKAKRAKKTLYQFYMDVCVHTPLCPEKIRGAGIVEVNRRG